MMQIVVVGCGYVGLVSGVCFASLGHDVLGIEVDEKRADLIRRGIVPFHEPGLEERLQSLLEDGRFRISTQIEDAAAGDVIFLCVQTPQGPDGNLNTDYLVAAARQVGEVVSKDGPRRVVVVRSTVTPGTTESLVRPALGADNRMISVASNPEFLREGSAVSDFLDPDRVVIGSRDEWAIDKVAELYAPLDPDIVRTIPVAAELAKCTSNALLATLISFSNEIARIAEAVPGVDVEEVLDIIHKDRRLSPVVDGETITPGILTYLRPGSGFGGSCLPKDLSAFAHFASSVVGDPTPILHAVMDINETQPARIVGLARDVMGALEGRPVTVLGLAFKAGTSDLRESPGLKIAELLVREGARVTAYDPLVRPNMVQPLAERGVTLIDSLEDAIRAADACVIATRAPEFRDVAKAIAETGRSDIAVIDGRRLLDPAAFEDDRYAAVGRSRRTGFNVSTALLGLAGYLNVATEPILSLA